jgi:hypothetical protein
MEITNLPLNAKIIDIEGKPVLEGQNELTYREILIRLLSSQAQGLTTAAKRQRYELAIKFANKSIDVIGVEANDLLMLKKMAEVLPTMLMGRLQDYLDGQTDGVLADPARSVITAEIEDVDADEAKLLQHGSGDVSYEPPGRQQPPQAAESAAEACAAQGT